MAAISVQTGICEGTLYRWKHQALVDAGLKEGTPSPDAGDLVSAHKRILHLENKLAIVKAANGMYDKLAVGDQSKKAIVDELFALGFSARKSCLTVGLNRSTYIKYLRAEPSIRAIRRSSVTRHPPSKSVEVNRKMLPKFSRPRANI